VLVIQSPTNNGPSSSTNCDTAAAAAAVAEADADRGCRVTNAAPRRVHVRPAATTDDDDGGRRWLGRAYRKQMTAWDSVRGNVNR